MIGGSLVTDLSPFHLAIPVKDLDETLAFYEELLQCSRGRESSDWVDLNFLGHQLVLHRVERAARDETDTNSAAATVRSGVIRFAAPIWSSAPHSENWQSLAIAPDTQQAAITTADKDFHMLGLPHWLVMSFKLPARAP